MMIDGPHSPITKNLGKKYMGTIHIHTPHRFGVKIWAKTYNSRDSRVVTHRNTNRPVPGLSTADQTGSPIFPDLWSYVKEGVSG
jgi:hypothetical protein